MTTVNNNLTHPPLGAGIGVDAPQGQDLPVRPAASGSEGARPLTGRVAPLDLAAKLNDIEKSINKKMKIERIIGITVGVLGSLLVVATLAAAIAMIILTPPASVFVLWGLLLLMPGAPITSAIPIVGFSLAFGRSDLKEKQQLIATLKEENNLPYHTEIENLININALKSNHLKDLSNLLAHLMCKHDAEATIEAINAKEFNDRNEKLIYAGRVAERPDCPDHLKIKSTSQFSLDDLLVQIKDFEIRSEQQRIHNANTAINALLNTLPTN